MANRGLCGSAAKSLPRFAALPLRLAVEPCVLFPTLRHFTAGDALTLRRTLRYKFLSLVQYNKRAPSKAHRSFTRE